MCPQSQDPEPKPLLQQRPPHRDPPASIAIGSECPVTNGNQAEIGWPSLRLEETTK